MSSPNKNRGEKMNNNDKNTGNHIMLSSQEYSAEDILDIDEMDNIKGADYLTQILIVHKEDVLYKILKKSNAHNEIITEEMREHLHEGVLYSTPETADLLNVPASTMRGWIQELDNYISPESQGRFIKLDSAAIFKLRMVAMLRDNNQYSVGHLKEITLGVDLITPGEEKELSINQKVTKMEKQLQGLAEVVKTQNQIIEQYGSTLWQLIDKEAFNEDGTIKLNQDNIVPLLEESTESKFEKIKEDVKSEIKEEINNEMQEYNRKQENTIKSYTREEVHRIMEERKPKTLMEKIFGKKK